MQLSQLPGGRVLQADFAVVLQVMRGREGRGSFRSCKAAARKLLGGCPAAARQEAKNGQKCLTVIKKRCPAELTGRLPAAMALSKTVRTPSDKSDWGKMFNTKKNIEDQLTVRSFLYEKVRGTDH